MPFRLLELLERLDRTAAEEPAENGTDTGNAEVNALARRVRRLELVLEALTDVLSDDASFDPRALRAALVEALRPPTEPRLTADDAPLGAPYRGPSQDTMHALGSSESGCARCGARLGPDETYVYADNETVCARCYGARDAR